MKQAPPPPPKHAPLPVGSNKLELRTALSLAELSMIFDVSPLVAKGRISTTKHSAKGKNGVYLWELADVCELIDKRIERDTINNLISKTKRNNKAIENGEEINPQNLTPANFKLHFQGLEAREMYLSKKYKNELTTGVLMHSNDVEDKVIGAFKTVVDFLSNLPDRLERDGLIDSDKIVSLVKYVDAIRDQLASDLENFTNE